MVDSPGEHIDIYDMPKRIRSAERRLETTPISTRNRDFIKQFVCYRKRMGVRDKTWLRDLHHLIRLATLATKDFDTFERKDVEALVDTLRDRTKAPRGYLIVLRILFRWFRGTEDYPPEVRWIRVGKVRPLKIDRNSLLTEEELDRLIRACHHPRDMALVAVLGEVGGRIEEILTLRVGDVTFDEMGAAWVNIHVSKTQPRRLKMVVYPTYLRRWLEIHPEKHNLRAPLWTLLRERGNVRYLRYDAALNLLERIAERAGVEDTRLVNPHGFRHASATNRAGLMSEPSLNHFYGWKQGSRMASYYVHLSDQGVGRTIDSIYGIIPPEEAGPKIKPQICPRCRTITSPGFNRCDKCGGALGHNVVPDSGTIPSPEGISPATHPTPEIRIRVYVSGGP